MASYQSLYRRYRPQRFDEVLGQAHVTKALRNAVRDDRVGHAYLFSGPRGTGKTSTARILAKVLNCDAPADGEPCGKCDNCVSVAEGRVTDWLLEQDAASKSKVDDMRDLLERVARERIVPLMEHESRYAEQAHFAQLGPQRLWKRVVAVDRLGKRGDLRLRETADRVAEGVDLFAEREGAHQLPLTRPWKRGAARPSGSLSLPISSIRSSAMRSAAL